MESKEKKKERGKKPNDLWDPIKWIEYLEVRRRRRQKVYEVIIENVPNLGRELDIQIHDIIEDNIISTQKKKKKNSKTDYNKIVKNQSKLRIRKSCQGKINQWTPN